MPFLLKLFKSGRVERAADEEESRDRVSAVTERVSPGGNIFRVLAQQSEFQKHQINLQRQLTSLCNTFGNVLDSSSIPLWCEDEATSHSETRYQQLLHLLNITTVSDLSDTEASSLKGTTGYAPITEFLNKGILSSLPCDLLTYPRKDINMWLKVRIMGLLVATIMCFGPPLILFHNVSMYDKTMKEANVNLHTLAGMLQELKCGVHATYEDCVTALGTLFLFVIFEIIRNYVAVEVDNAKLLAKLPAYPFWARVGQVSNGLCCLATGFTCAAVFANELTAKDIVYDSLALLFIFTIDDLSNDVMIGLTCTEDDFKKDYMWLISLLSLCPVELKDVTNPDAKTPEEIWKIRLDCNGLLTASGEHCKCRLVDNSGAPDESSPLIQARKQTLSEDSQGSFRTYSGAAEDMKLVDYTIPSSYSYTTMPGYTYELPVVMRCFCNATPIWVAWQAIYYIIFLGEFIMPPAFFFFSKPCAT